MDFYTIIFGFDQFNTNLIYNQTYDISVRVGDGYMFSKNNAISLSISPPNSIPIITGVTGCLYDIRNNNGFIQTEECYPSTVLTISGKSFRLPLSVEFWSGPPFCLDVSLVNDTTLTCRLSDIVLNRQLGAQLFPKVISEGYWSPYTFNDGWSMRWATSANTRPTVVSVSGCDDTDGDYANTRNCRRGDRIVITGSAMLPDLPPRMLINNVACTDTVVESFYQVSCIPWAESAGPPYPFDVLLNIDVQFNNVRLTLSSAISFDRFVDVSSSSSSTGTAAPVGPIISGVYGCTDSLGDTVSRYTFNCIPDVVITIVGQSFYSTDLTIVFIDGMLECTDVIVMDDTRLTCSLPTPTERRAFGTLLIVTVLTLSSVNQRHNNLTLSSPPFYGVAYMTISNPNIRQVTGDDCTEHNSATSALCPFSTTLSFRGTFFMPDTVFAFADSSRVYRQCDELIYHSFFHMSCVVDASSYAKPNQAFTLYNMINGVESGNAGAYVLFIYQPTITRITAAASACTADGSTVVDCTPGAIITITGTNFFTTLQNSYCAIDNVRGSLIGVTPNTTLICQTSILYNTAQYGTPLPVTIFTNNVLSVTRFTISMAIPKPPTITGLSVPYPLCANFAPPYYGCSYTAKYTITGSSFLRPFDVVFNGNIPLNVTSDVAPSLTLIVFTIYNSTIVDLPWLVPNNMTFSNAFGSFTLHDAMAFRGPAVIINGAAGCGSTTQAINCVPFEEVYVFGQNFFPPLTMNFPSSFPGQNARVNIVNSSLLVVRLPALRYGSDYGLRQCYLTITSQGQTSSIFYGISYIAPQQPVITGISGCQGTNPLQATNCGLYDIINITGSWLLSPETSAVRINRQYNTCFYVLADTFNQVRCKMQPYGNIYNQDRYYPIEISNGYSNNIINNAISFTENTPIIYNLKGCNSPIGLNYTINCIPISNILTINGINFAVNVRVIMPDDLNPSCNIVSGSSTQITCRFSVGLTDISRYNGQLIPVHVINPTMNLQSNSIDGFSFNVIQPPSVTTCVGCNTAAALYSTTFRLTGQWLLFELQVTMDDVPMILSAVDYFSTVTVRLPTDVFVRPLTAHSLVITNRHSSITYRSNITFALPKPTVSIHSCQSIGCLPNTTLTLRGTYFVYPTSPSQINVTILAPNYNMTCSNVTVISSTILTCILPQPTADLYGRTLSIIVTVQRSSDRYGANLYPALSRPEITSVTGCNVYGPNNVNCEASDWITIAGRYFTETSVATVGVLTCQSIVFDSFYTLRCQLPSDLSYYIAGQLYDLTIATGSLLTVRSRIIGFGSYSSTGVYRPAPILSSAVERVNIQPGDVVVVNGYYFFDTVQVAVMTLNNVLTALASANWATSNSTVMFVRMPEFKRADDYGKWYGIRLQSAEGNSATIPYVAYYAGLSPPIAERLTGCEDNGCYPGQEIGISGANYALPIAVYLYANQTTSCQNVTIISVTRLTCIIPLNISFVPLVNYSLAIMVNSRLGAVSWLLHIIPQTNVTSTIESHLSLLTQSI